MSCPDVSRQSGVAMIMVMVIVALITIIATQMTSGLLLQQRRLANIWQTDQAYHYALGTEALAAAKLQDALKSDQERVHAGQLWNQPFTFPIEEGGGILRARLFDLSACFNVNALLLKSKKSGEGKADQHNPAEQQMTTGERLYLRLLEQVVADAQTPPPALVASLRDWLDEDTEPFGGDGAEDYEYMGYQLPYRTGNSALGAISELRTIKGYDPEIYKKLRPYLCALPDVKYLKINVNTLPPERAELLAMLYKDLTVETAKSVLQNRPKDGWTSENWRTASQMPAEVEEYDWAKGMTAFTTSYFLVQSEAIVGRGRARVESILKANDDKTWSVVSRAFAEE